MGWLIRQGSGLEGPVDHGKNFGFYLSVFGRHSGI